MKKASSVENAEKKQKIEAIARESENKFHELKSWKRKLLISEGREEA